MNLPNFDSRNKRIGICASASCYRQALDAADVLTSRGDAATVPKVAARMREIGDYRVETYKTWFQNPDDYSMKNDYVLSHFREIAEGDAVLVVNEPKNEVAGYIGGAVLMEMAIALYLGKPIFLLHPPAEQSPYLEEILAMQPMVLDGDLTKLSL